MTSTANGRSEPADDPRPLADRLRPSSLDEYVGQTHLFGPGKPLRRMLEGGHLHSMILWGPPGTGKTTLARLVAQQCDAEFIALSAVMAGVKDIRAAAEQATEAKKAGRRTVLFLDEVHRFNKAQQDAFLPHMEDGTIILVGATLLSQEAPPAVASTDPRPVVGELVPSLVQTPEDAAASMSSSVPVAIEIGAIGIRSPLHSVGLEDDAVRWSDEGKTVVSLVEDGKVTAVFAGQGHGVRSWGEGCGRCRQLCTRCSPPPNRWAPSAVPAAPPTGASTTTGWTAGRTRSASCSKTGSAAPRAC